MSVMNGFEKELQDRILGVVPHAVIYSDESIPEYINTIKILKENDNILEAAPYISLQGLISSSSSSKGVSITGIDVNAEPNMSIIPNYMVYQGSRMATSLPLYYLLIMYGMLYFS